MQNRLKKILIIGFGSILVMVMLVISLVSPIAKYLIEKYAVKYTGRQVKVGWVYVNLFTGFVHISNLKIYESKGLPALTNGDSVFFSTKGLSVNLAMLKLLSGTIEITQFTLNQPVGFIIQNNKDFNFNDLIKKFTPEKSGTKSSQLHFNILNIKIKNGEFCYRELVTPINYFIKEVNFESNGIHWYSDTIAAKFSLVSGYSAGSVQGNFTINLKTLDYRVAAIVQKFDLKLIEQYFKVLVNYGNLSASIDADVKATGNLNDQENINAGGMMAINDFHFGKNADDDYVSFDKLVLKADRLNPKNHEYVFDSISIFHPILKYEQYDYLDNLQMMFGKNGARISEAKAHPARFNLIIKIAEYIKILAKNFFQSDYKINKLAIYKGILKYNDYSLTEKFSIEANSLFVNADSINKKGKRVIVNLNSGILPYGKISVTLSINPRDSDFDVNYKIQNLAASMFNAYLLTYTSFPLDRGTIEVEGAWKVRKGIIQSNNHLLIIDPRISKRLINKDTKWIPTSFIMYFIRESGNVIDYEIPITGNLKNPHFHLHDVINDMLGNIFVKPATAPYRIQVKRMENEIEKALTLKWEIRQNSLLPDQEKFLKKMVVFLAENPAASISVYPIQYADKEKEYIRFFEAKKEYFLASKNKNDSLFSKNDSLKVDKMSVKDPLFSHFLNKIVNDTMLFTIQEKCDKFVSSVIVNVKFNQLNKQREDTFMRYFKNKNAEKRIKIYGAENNVPYNGYSFYKIVYNGELPKSLIKAYREMDELNNEAPRKKFEKEREKDAAGM